MTSPDGTIELLIRIANRTCNGGDFTAWATGALTDGFDSPSLRRLAALDSAAALADAQPLFDRSVRELKLSLPESPDVLRRAYLKLVAADIVNGSRTPAEALETIHQEVINPLNHPEDLMPWCYLWEGNDPDSFETDIDDDAIAAKAIALAKIVGGDA